MKSSVVDVISHYIDKKDVLIVKYIKNLFFFNLQRTDMFNIWIWKSEMDISSKLCKNKILLNK